MTPDTKPSEVELFPTPRMVGMEALGGDVIALVGGAIVNPFGPTLLLTALTGPWRPGSDMPIIQASINPFSQELQHVGVFKVRGLFDPLGTLLSVVPRSIPGCPTALLVSPLLRERAEDIWTVTSRYLANCEHASGTLEGVRQFPGDPRSRVKQEIDAGMKIMLARQRGEDAPWPEQRRLTFDESMELVCSQLTRSHWLQEWQGFVMCWSESIGHVREQGLDRPALPFGHVESLVSNVINMTGDTMAATVPDWDKEPAES
jgi:hypothetical protein